LSPTRTHSTAPHASPTSSLVPVRFVPGTSDSRAALLAVVGDDRSDARATAYEPENPLKSAEAALLVGTVSAVSLAPGTVPHLHRDAAREVLGLGAGLGPSDREQRVLVVDDEHLVTGADPSSAAVTNFAKALRPSRTNGSLSSPTTIRWHGAANPSRIRRPPAIPEGESPVSAVRDEPVALRAPGVVVHVADDHLSGRPPLDRRRVSVSSGGNSASPAPAPNW